MAPTANTSVWASSNHLLVVTRARARTTGVMTAANLGPLASMSMAVLLAADEISPKFHAVHDRTLRQAGASGRDAAGWAGVGSGAVTVTGGPAVGSVRPHAGARGPPTQRGGRPEEIDGAGLRQHLRGP